ncbi:MAG TPA: YggT family protein [Candidatus Dormibacteraeota bacterium]|nr:YggT family protein [Candidatus Dormibacteraeota bacterium]
MSEHLQEVRNVTNGGVTTKTTRVVDDDANAPTQCDQQSLIVARIVWFIAGVLLVLLAFRFVLILLGANPANGFANFIYNTSNPFAAPFFGIFGYSIKYGVSRVEVSTLVAMAVYALVAYGICKLLTLGRSSNK